MAVQARTIATDMASELTRGCGPEHEGDWWFWPTAGGCGPSAVWAGPGPKLGPTPGATAADVGGTAAGAGDEAAVEWFGEKGGVATGTPFGSTRPALAPDDGPLARGAGGGGCGC